MKKFVIIAIVISVLIGIVYYFYFVYPFNDTSDIINNESSKDYVVDFNDVNVKIYFRARVWGISSDHEEVRVSFSPIDIANNYDSKKEIIFYTSEVYYRKSTDSLFIYAPSSSIPNGQNNLTSNKIKIIIIELNGYDDVKKYENHYQEYGLSKISPFS
ncbi:MAG: hypothetical protein QM768_04640 [Agriterribacter sp.]